MYSNTKRTWQRVLFNILAAGVIIAIVAIAQTCAK